MFQNNTNRKSFDVRRCAMSTTTISSLTPMSRETLSEQLLSSPPPNLAIIDVRDSDHVGGHIKGSVWLPNNTLDLQMPELL